MPRTPRVHYKGAIYHVMLRGNNRRQIFFNVDDYLIFNDYLHTTINKYFCKVHLFCLMTNHIHLVIEVADIPLSKIMQRLTTGYTLKINHCYQRCGHIFQGRYKAKLVENENYLLELCYYIHNNPVKAGMVTSIDDYQWSSHLVYLNKIFLPWVTTNKIFSLIQQHLVIKDKKYEKFIYENKVFFENPKFFEIDEAGKVINIDSINNFIETQEILKFTKIEFSTIISTVSKHFNISESSLTSLSSNRKTVFVRTIIAFLAHYYGGFLIKEIAYKFGRSPNSFSRNFHRNLKILRSDKKFDLEINLLLKILAD